MGNQKVKKERLDVMLVEQGFFDSRENAKRHIMAGIILVNDVPVDKAGTKIPVDAKLRIKGHVMPYVGRGGYKLEAVINHACISLFYCTDCLVHPGIFSLLFFSLL